MRISPVTRVLAMLLAASPAFAGEVSRPAVDMGRIEFLPNAELVFDTRAVTNAPVYQAEFRVEGKNPAAGISWNASISMQSGHGGAAQVANTRSYLEAVSYHPHAGILSGLYPAIREKSTSTGQVTSGWSLVAWVQPRDDGRVSLDWAVSDSWLAGSHHGFDEVAINGEIIQRPRLLSVTDRGSKTIVVPGHWTEISGQGALTVMVRVTQSQGI